MRTNKSVNKSKKSNLEYDHVITYFKEFKWTVIALSISGLIFNGLSALIPIFQGYLIQDFSDFKPLNSILLSACVYLGFVLFVQLNRFFKRWFIRLFSNKMVLKMREVSFKNLLYDDINEFSKTTKGDIMNKNLSDIKDSAEGIRKVTTEVFDTGVLLCGYIISMFILNWKTTLFIFPFFIFSAVLALKMKNKIVSTTKSYKTEYSKGKDVTLNFINNEIYYRGFGASDKYYTVFEKEMDEIEKKTVVNLIFKNSFQPIYYLVAILCLVFVIYFNAQNIVDGNWMIGSFSAYLTTYMLTTAKIKNMGKMFNSFAIAKVSWERCKPYLKSKILPKKIDVKDEASLVVNNLTFGFDESFKVENINFYAQKGEIIGICGKVRSGKSTLGAVLSGIYNYEGSIKVCNLELKDVKNKTINNFIGYAPANTEIFADTIKFNISFGKCGNIAKAINDACLREDVNQFSNKENEILSHSLLNISGGQQRRLQIARSIFNNSKLIILDDPFNAIGISTSIEIINNFKKDYRNSIFVIINNQSETLSMFDKILFLNGKNTIFDSYENMIENKEFKKLMGIPGGEYNERA